MDVAVVEAEITPDQANDGQIRRIRPERHSAARQDRPASKVLRAGELSSQSRLAYAWLAHQCHELTVALTHPRCERPKLSHLGFASHESRQAARDRHLKARPDRAAVLQLIRLHRRRQTFDRDGPHRAGAHVPLDETQGVHARENRPRRRCLFHPRRQVGGLADRRVVHVQVVADRPHHDFARVESHADLHRGMRARALGVAAQLIAHPERGVAGAYGMILVGNRGAEQRHDAVAQDLVDDPFEVMHGLDHQVEDRVEDLTRVLGVESREQLHRPSDVREEDRHLLALALDGRSRLEDLLDEMPRRV